MKPYWTNDIATLYLSNALSLPIPDESVDCVVTSPPYWGLRDYGTATWVGGDSDCDHTVSHYSDNMKPNVDRPFRGDRSSCLRCGAERVDEQIGLEKTPEEFVETMVNVFREVRRVLKSTGTVWLNLGDSYIGGGRGFEWVESGTIQGNHIDAGVKYGKPTGKVEGLKSKDLAGIPWRVAFALQADGWYLRSDIIWSKPNPMPESVTDRPTKAHEYIFLLTKSPKYYYDADAIREDGPSYTRKAGGYNQHYTQGASRFGGKGGFSDSDVKTVGRNKRSVWEITTQPYPEAHFATYPEKLVEPCIMAGTSEKGVCSECGKPWERDIETTTVPDRETRNNRIGVIPGRDHASRMNSKSMEKVGREIKGWKPTCTCNADTVPATVLDPFVGSGTTLAVAQRLGRNGIGADINDEYLELAKKRLSRLSAPMKLF